jgi:drug/metabolite transporter (DMT)-like permease
MSSSHNRKMKIAPWALLAVAASWGYAFVVMKDAIEKQSVNSFLFSRFAVAVIAMIALKPSVIRNFNKEILTKGILAGLFLGSGYIFQTLGLKLTVLQLQDLSPAFMSLPRQLLLHSSCATKFLASRGLALLSLQLDLPCFHSTGGALDLASS